MPQDETEIFQHYRVLRRGDGSLWKLGAGAMGVTYKAIDTNLDAPVALKVINALYTSNDDARERFIREARAAASLRHRNVASIHHLGRDAQSFFYAMEFIDGETVEHFIGREGPQPWQVALPAVLQVTRALMAAHEKRLVHRDIKPANIMLVRETGEDDFGVKLIDFGLAKSLVEKEGSVVNGSTSGFLGTPLYASPEQCEELTPDIRSDIYSLGVTLWFILAGRPPFVGNLVKVLSQHVHAPLPWEQLPAAVPAPIRALIGRMLAKDRAARPPTPADLRHEITSCFRTCEGITPAVSPGPFYPSAKERVMTISPPALFAPEAVMKRLAARPPSAGFRRDDSLWTDHSRLAEPELTIPIIRLSEITIPLMVNLVRKALLGAAVLFVLLMIIGELGSPFVRENTMRLKDALVYFHTFKIHPPDDAKALILDKSAMIREFPDDANAYEERGNAFFRLGMYDRALKDINEAIELVHESIRISSDGGTNSRLYTNRAQVYRALNDPSHAAKDESEARNREYEAKLAKQRSELQTAKHK